jgi:hypothetical protein
MDSTWWHFVAGLAMILAAIWDCISSPREARRLRIGGQGARGSHAEAIAKERRAHQRLRWLIAPGVMVCGFLGGWGIEWGGNILPFALGVWTLTSGVVAFVCLRILGPPAQRPGELMLASSGTQVPAGPLRSVSSVESSSDTTTIAAQQGSRCIASVVVVQR